MKTNRQKPPRLTRDGITRSAAGVALALTLSLTANTAMAQTNQQDLVVRLAGAGNMGGRMALELATAFAKQLKLPAVRVDSGVDPDEYEVIAEGAESKSRMRVQVHAKGSGSGFEPLARGQVDIWASARPAREGDLENARKKGLTNLPTVAQLRQPGNENVVGLDALVIITSPKNPVAALTTDQIRAIFAGKVTSWAQVGGPSNLPITVYAAELPFGTNDAFCTNVMGNTNTAGCMDSFPRLGSPRFPFLEDLSDAVASNPGGIAFTDLSERRSAKLLSLNNECGVGVEPSVFRIKADEYALSRRLYYYAYPGRPMSPAAKEFLQFALSPAGQAAVKVSGMADLAPSKADPEYGSTRLDSVREVMDGGHTRVRAPDVKAFETATGGADRLSITFRFQSGTNTLDSRAEEDMNRLVSLMQHPAYANASLVLIGYSSAAGDYGENRTLSRDRADTVRDRLMAAGIKNVTSIGIGPGAAVACNLDPTTAPLNQRVEVWVRGLQVGG